jgi:radical SAM-linked protein
VGVIGENEYLDVELTEDWNSDDLEKILQANLHDGFGVVAVRRIEAQTPALEAAIDRFDYLIRFDSAVFQSHSGGLEGLEASLKQRLTNGGWLIERTIKNKRKRVNAAEFVTSWTFSANNGHTDWHLILTSREGRCVKPRELVESLFGGYPDGTLITRVRMGRMVGEQFVTPLDAQPA